MYASYRRRHHMAATPISAASKAPPKIASTDEVDGGAGDVGAADGAGAGPLISSTAPAAVVSLRGTQSILAKMDVPKRANEASQRVSVQQRSTQRTDLLRVLVHVPGVVLRVFDEERPAIVAH